jgi:hypothetical protein
VTIAIAVQHHPRRGELLPPLLQALEPCPVDVVSDQDPGGRLCTWPTYRRALELTPAWATHRLVLQDDVEFCPGFLPVLDRVVAARPDRLVALCVCGNPAPSAYAVRQAHVRGESFVELPKDRWVPTIALVWPAQLIVAALEFVDAARWPATFLADDEIVMRVCEGLGIRALACVPSIVEHPDRVHSVMSKRRASGGANPGRVAACFVPAGVDPLDLAWT